MKDFIATVLLLALAMGSPRAVGQTPKHNAPQAQTLDALCSRLPCLHDLHIRLVREDGSLFERTYKQLPPTVQNDFVAVYAGQTVHVEADIDHGKLVHLHAVDTIKHPKRTLTLHLWQDAKNGMMLTVSNPFDKMLKFHMAIMPLAHPVALKTSSCPVVAHGFSMENWPEPLFQVFIEDGHSVDAAHNPGCVD